ncbi:MAG TPA: carboxypeptidase-like regulatory domain-containing protein [Thermoplasmata archaeon]|nr:carboxypeptidase-like regulatory domain-containing protein [Thermoplasmata archaeon]
MTPGQTYDVGIINLTKEGTISAQIEGSDPTHEKVACTVLVAVISRSSLTLGANVTVGNGLLTNLPVPPFPSIVSFDPKCPQYQTNQYWVNVSAYTNFNMGPVYLPVNTVVQAHIYDAVTKRAVSGEPAEIQVCSVGNTGNCGPKGPTVGTANPKAWAPPGYDQLTGWADDLNGEPAMTNVTMVGSVPALPPGHVFELPNVYVVPLGIIGLDVGLTYMRQIKAENVLSKWPVGMVVVQPSSLDGYTQWSNYNPMTRNFTTGGPPTTCVNVASNAYLYAPPLRDSVTITPDTAATCFPPVPTWPIPTYLPAFGNESVVNVTPNNNYYSPMGYLNLTPGTYVEGGIYGPNAAPVNGQSLIPISATTTDQVGSLAAPSWPTYVTAQPNPPNHPGFDPAGCPAGSWNIFCVPAPFGPSKITATGTTIQNYTWIDIPPGYYTGSPMLIQSYDTAPLVHITNSGAITASGGVGALDFTNGSISGRLAVEGTGGVPYGLGTIIVAPAGTAAPQEQQSTCTSNPTTGTFICSANAGWNLVTATAPLYLENHTWVYVPSANAAASAGTIYMTPLVTIQGQVVTGSGVGILQASAQYCAIASQTGTACQNLGTTGTTNSNGQYSGLVPPYPLPRGAYKLIFTATGFTSNWTWVNATTPGGIVNASTVALYSQTTTSGASGRPALGGPPSSAPLLSEWAVGNVVDNTTGLPVEGLAIQWQTPGGPVNSVGSTDTNNLDDFNTSVSVGAIYLNFSATGYLPSSLYLNVTGLDQGAVDFLPTVSMQPEAFITGRVEIGPANWTSLSTQDGLGPGQTTVTACTQRQVCGQAFYADEGGFFNISAPTAAGQFEYIKVFPKFSGTGTLQGGFSSNTGFVNFTGTPVVVNDSEPVLVNVFGIVLGEVYDHSTNNSTPVRWPTARLMNGVGSINTTIMISGGGGEVYGITPETFGKNLLMIQASALSYLQAQIGNGTVGWGAATFMGNLSLPHFGWVAGLVESAVGKNISVPWATVSVSTYYGSPPINFGSSGTANGAGYVNVSSPPGIKGTISITAPDYNSTNATGFSVNESATSTLSVLLKKALGGLTPWGWVTGTVEDNAYHFPLPGAVVDLTSRYSTTGTSVNTNGAGVYRIDAPAGPSANVSINLTDYSGNYTRVSVVAGATATARLVNLTGDGIVAGFVISYPQGVPIPFANVSLCSQAEPLCSNIAIANGSGAFWIAGPPGLDNLTVSYNDFVTTSRPVNVTSDGWIWVGVVKLDEYAFLSGTVIGLPSGIPVDGANVSACSTLAFSEGAVICAYTTVTSANGQFFLAVPADNYIIQVNATLYNTTFLPIQLLPGETVSMGLIELEQYGIAVGHIFGQDTDGPLTGGLLTACPTWEIGNCTSVNTNPISGQYLFSGPPGPYALTAAAPNYDKAGELVTLISGYLVKAPTIFLEPIGPAYRFHLQGTVLAESTAPGGAISPYAGAVVSDNVGDAATTDSQGQFSLSVSWGDIVLSVTANGYQKAQFSQQVRGNVTGLTVTLVPMTYVWTGYVTDGVNRQPLGGVGVTLGPGGLQIATTITTGLYTLSLPNGTFDLDAGFADGSSLALAYPTIPFVLTVNGAGGTHNLEMFPPLRTLVIQVVNRASGIPIQNATVVVAGVTRPENVGLQVPGTTNLNGSVAIGVYTGIYNVTASSAGYLTGSVTTDSTGSNATLSVIVELAPISVSGASGPGLTPAIGAALAGGIVALAAGLYLFSRRLSTASRGASASPATPVGMN